MKLRMLLIIVIGLLIISCGGQTRGTGGANMTTQQFTIKGQVLNQSLVPIQNASVTILETGDSSTTDSQGIFIIETEKLSLYTIEIESPSEVNEESSKFEIIITNVPEATTSVNTTIRLDSMNEASAENSFQE